MQSQYLQKLEELEANLQLTSNEITDPIISLDMN
jgi:hypothetical protein